MHDTSLGTAPIVGIAVAILVATVAVASAQDNTITFDNKSGEPALVRLIGPTPVEVAVPQGKAKTVIAGQGRYHIRVRYGTAGRFRYTKGDEFDVTQSATSRSKIAITLHKVTAGNYKSKPISAEKFEQKEALLKLKASSKKPGSGAVGKGEDANPFRDCRIHRLGEPSRILAANTCYILECRAKDAVTGKVVSLFQRVYIGERESGTAIAIGGVFANQDCMVPVPLAWNKDREAVFIDVGQHIDHIGAHDPLNDRWTTIYRKVTVAHVKGIGKISVSSEYYSDEECTHAVAIGMVEGSPQILEPGCHVVEYGYKLDYPSGVCRNYPGPVVTRLGRACPIESGWAIDPQTRRYVPIYTRVNVIDDGQGGTRITDFETFRDEACSKKVVTGIKNGLRWILTPGEHNIEHLFAYDDEKKEWVQTFARVEVK